MGVPHDPPYPCIISPVPILPLLPDLLPLSFLLPGNYHSTKIWEFRMTHHCGSLIIITTDPKNAQYCVVEGARQKVSHWVAGVGG